MLATVSRYGNNYRQNFCFKCPNIQNIGARGKFFSVVPISRGSPFQIRYSELDLWNRRVNEDDPFTTKMMRRSIILSLVIVTCAH